eukprot:223390_1
MDFSTQYEGGIKSHLNGNVLTISMCNPKKRNAVDRITARALAKAFLDFENNDSAHVAVLYGEGGCFCAGADLKSVSTGINSPKMIPVGQGDGPMGPTRLHLSKPVIAAIAGHCVAGGLELALWCDMRVMEEGAVMGVFCRRWGVPLVDGGTVRLPRLIGQANALDLILTGRAVGARECASMGLAQRVVSQGRALVEAQELAAEIARFPQACMRADRLSAINQHDMSLEKAMENEFNEGIKPAVRSEIRGGATNFARGSGRHGSFRDIRSSEISKSHKSETMCPFDCVLFDLGGVVFDSPVEAIERYQRRMEDSGRIPKGVSFNQAFNLSEAFHDLETGKFKSVKQFAKPFEQQVYDITGVRIDAVQLFKEMENIKPRPQMISAIKILKLNGFQVGAITNNWDPSGRFPTRLPKDLFDDVIESCVVGIRKPDTRIYELACRRLGITDKSRVIFLDDLGRNLKPARAMGMSTIKVTSAEQGLQELSRLVGIDLLSLTSEKLTSKL